MPRKPTGKAKTKVVPVRFTGEQLERLKVAADKKHLAVSTWLHQVAMDEADRVVDAKDRVAREK
ncbi:MAG TPA: hypothetical protein VHO06_12525 [Polyangia bacterium]|nr:hypothetical protein [Polyangia bacterium]